MTIQENFDQKTFNEKLESLKNFIEDNRDINNYLARSTTWSDSEINKIKTSEKIAWRIAYGSSGITCLMLAALIGLTPLKTIIPPLVLKMDQSTGLIEPLESVENVKKNIQDVFTKKFINDFMLARENYTYDTAQLNYETAAAFMSSKLQIQWEHYWDTNNPYSPFKIYKKDSTVHIIINSIILSKNVDNKKNVATIHFIKNINHSGILSTSYWVATLTYQYINTPSNEAIRRINPIGFEVRDYHVDPEIADNFNPKNNANV